MSVVLQKPSLAMKDRAAVFKESFLQSGERIYGCCGFQKMDSYEGWLAYIDRVSRGLQPERLPSSTYFAVEGGTGEIVGITDIRHTLNAEHYNSGHIGYSVRPDRRRRGYATEILRQGLEIAARLCIGRAMVSCAKDNEGSRRVILGNGGALDHEFDEEGARYEMYGIVIKKEGIAMKFAGICLITKNVRALAGFYAKALGAAAEGDEGHSTLSAGGLDMAFFSTEGMEGMAPGSTKGAGTGGFTVTFTVDDVDGEYERIKALGAEILMPPRTHPWGWRSFFFRDPDGNIVVFNCPAK